MAAGDIFQGKFVRTKQQGAADVAGQIGGTTYSYFRIKADGHALVGNNNIDPDGGSTTQHGYRLSPGEVFELRNDGAVAGAIDGAKLRFIAAEEADKRVTFNLLAIANV